VAAKMKSWSDLRARYAAGVWAAPFALLPGFLLSAALGLPSPLEPLAQLIIQLTPIAAANMLLDFFGALARPLALLGALAICLPFAGCCGMLAPGSAPRWRWARWALSGALALAGAGVLALGADDAAGVWPALLAGVCFLPAFWLVRGFRQPAPSLAGRRRALKTLAGAALSAASIATIGAYQFWSSLGQTLLGRGDSPTPLFPFRSPAPRGPGFPVAGLAPEVTPAASFYYNSKNTTDPVIPTDTWELSVGGHVARPFRLTIAQLRTLPRVDQYVTLRCVDNLPDGHLMSNALWSGVPIAALLQRAVPLPGAQAIILHAADAFDEVFPLSYFADDRALLAYGINGETLTRARGAPARAVVPGFYGFKNVKWVESIEVSASFPSGFWEAHGWTASAPHLNARIDIARREGADVLLAGFAFAGAMGVSAVQVQVNEGAWQDAVLNAPALSPFAWVQWRVILPLPHGTYTFTARAIDGAGHLQESTVEPVYPNGATGLDSMQVQL
jgi:DMSO/TMAO reductase YedYZ molybdopterin-dependent catalytic subunit